MIFKIAPVKVTTDHNFQTIIMLFKSLCHRVVRPFFACLFVFRNQLTVLFLKISLNCCEPERDCLIVVEIYYNPLFKIFYFVQQGLGNI